MQRVSVVGSPGAGKSGLARRLAVVLGAPHVELDAIHHLPGWKAIEPDKFLAAVTAIAVTDAWVIDGNYRTVVVDGPVWARADTVVWLDLPRPVVMRQIVGRTLERLVRREVLWNGNREGVRNLLSWDPNKSIIRWAWTNYAKYQDRYRSATVSPALAHITFVRLGSHDEADTWLAGLREGAHGDGGFPA